MAQAPSHLWYDRLKTGNLPTASSVFTDSFGVSREAMRTILNAALSKGGEFAELFFEYKIAHSVSMEEGIIKQSSESVSLGVGIRVLKGDQTGYGYTNELTLDKMKKAALTAASISTTGARPICALFTEVSAGHQVYDLKESLAEQPLKTKVNLVKSAYESAQSYDRRISMVRSFLVDDIQYVTIVNSEGLFIGDARPLVRLMTVAVAEENGQRNSGFKSAGGRVGMTHFKKVVTPAEVGNAAAEEAVTLLSATPPVAGEQPVVLGSGQSGVMVHEAVGHPFEADGIRKKTSIFWDKFGEQVANPIVNIYEDPTLPHFRGSLNIDDEGMATQKTVLVEKGKLVGFIQDRLNAQLLGHKRTGNGRRETYQDYPIPRMTNTVLASGDHTPEEIIESVKKGFYAKSFEGGQVSDSGKFTFSANLGYLIENGRLTQPVRNATLIGTNVQILNEVSMIGNDMDYFLGTCGKEGQSAPVTAGTPTMKIDAMTVGGR